MSRSINSKGISFYPRQMDICFSEKCNLNCDYCFVNKTSEKVLDIKKIKSAIDIFLDFPGKNKTITFTTSEPFINPKLFRDSITYIFQEVDKKDVDILVIATTNGVLFNREMQAFIKQLDDRFILNFSLDGKEDSHDAHRKIKNSKNSSFELAIKNFNNFSRKNGYVRIISTIAPDQVNFLLDNVKFIIKQGFLYIDLFPQMFKIWSKKERDVLEGSLNSIVNKINKKETKLDLRVLNRLWGSTHYAKIMLGADGKFYLFEWVLPLEEKHRKLFQIGDYQHINLVKRKKLFELLFNQMSKANKSKCNTCEYNAFCSDPLPLYLWSLYNKYDFLTYFKNFCQISKIMIRISDKIKIKNRTDKSKWDKLLKNKYEENESSLRN